MPIKPLTTLNIEEEFLLRIGNENAPHSISWDILRNVGDKLEALILSIAKYSTEEAAVAIENFKLEFSGFYDGSAVPGFRLNSHPTPTIFDDNAARREVQREFTSIVSSLSKGNYQAIVDIYNTGNAKNDIIRKVYDFSNSAGNLKVSFVKRTQENKFKELFSLRKLKRETLEELITTDSRDIITQSTIETSGVARVVTKKGPSGKTRTKTQEVYNDQQAILSLKLSEISFGTRKYILRSPIFFQIETEGKGKIIENESFDIYAAGKTINQAKEELYFQFDNTYRRLNALDDKQLGKRLLEVKGYYNFYVNTMLDI